MLSCNKRQNLTRVVDHVKKSRRIILAGWRLASRSPVQLSIIIFYRYHTFLATLIQFVDIEMVVFDSVERRLIHSVFYWTFLPTAVINHTRPSAQKQSKQNRGCE